MEGRGCPQGYGLCSLCCLRIAPRHSSPYNPVWPISPLLELDHCPSGAVAAIYGHSGGRAIPEKLPLVRLPGCFVSKLITEIGVGGGWLGSFGIGYEASAVEDRAGSSPEGSASRPGYLWLLPKVPRSRALPEPVPDGI